MELKDFGLSLAKIRQTKDISQYELSLRIGKSENYIHRVENGGVNISIKAMFEICRELGINPCELFSNWKA